MARPERYAEFISDDHYAAFGRIMLAYAAADSLLEDLLAAYIGIAEPMEVIAFSQYGFDQKHSMSVALTPEMQMTKQERARIDRFLTIVKNHVHLRNKVAHNTWRPGRKQGTIKPASVSTKRAMKVIGHKHNEKAWSAKDLHDTADAVWNECQSFKDFLANAGRKRMKAD